MQGFPQDMAFVLVLVSFAVAKAVVSRELLMAHVARVYRGAPDGDRRALSPASFPAFPPQHRRSVFSLQGLIPFYCQWKS